MFPTIIPNWISGKQQPAVKGEHFTKFSPHTGAQLFQVANSDASDVEEAVSAAKAAQPAWTSVPAVQRGMILLNIVRRMQDEVDALAQCVARETGKSLKDAKGEVGGATQLGLFYASEGQRLYGRTTTSGVVGKHAMTVRQPIGVAGLIVAANTPIANVAWKVFPALICGNTVVLKAPEDAPATAWLFARIAHDAGLPPGVLNVLQGLGPRAGEPLVEHPDVGVVSFTGSTRVGQLIHQKVSNRLARVSLELGGKNALVVCDDADIDNAVKWTMLSAFSNAGQRCAAASRVIIFESVYDQFRNRLLAGVAKLKVGPSDSDDFGPVISERQLKGILAAIDTARKEGAAIIAGGSRLEDPAHAGGYYIEPTLLENVDPASLISRTELFGPVAALYRVKDFASALKLTNQSPYGLTACIHTRNFSRALEFCDKVQTGVAVVNAGTYGSEPHMPFGGHKLSGNGTREPGTEALDVYSELKDIYMNVDFSVL